MDKSLPGQQVFETTFATHLKIESYLITIESILGPTSKDTIDYSPYYQRNYVWDNNKASYFIESILLGTEIPPLVFFNNKENIEIIDGRQRFETILRFCENRFALKSSGLAVLRQLKTMTFKELRDKDQSIVDLFLDTKIRIIGFTIVNPEVLDKHLEDRVKKEIFARYNSGITPLKNAEIYNAVYDDDSISHYLKKKITGDKQLQQSIYNTFFKPREKYAGHPPIANLMDFVRKMLVLPKIPISYYASGAVRKEILTKMYQHVSRSTGEPTRLVDDFIGKVDFVGRIKNYMTRKELSHNRLVFQCLIWGLYVIEMEGAKIPADNRFVEELAKYLSANIDQFNDQDYHYTRSIMARYAAMTLFLEQKFNIDLRIYRQGNTQIRAHLKELQMPHDAKTKISELDAMRLNKPEPFHCRIEAIQGWMMRGRFLVRPSYQREEVIKKAKSSLIIESILLGITLPAIYIYKRADGLCEVIDGQQRLLTILGFIGASYVDEKGDSLYAKNNKFRLQKLRILKELEGKRYVDLDSAMRRKILHFSLYLVEVEENKNPDFNPVDLFIRLNDKPYPIREHSFEMWNSWVDYELIDKIKDMTRHYYPWFFVKQFNEKNRDRMENQELFAALIFLEVSAAKKDHAKAYEIFQKGNRINARLSDKSHITHMLQEVVGNEKARAEFHQALKRTHGFVSKVKYILLDRDKAEEELSDYLRHELDGLFRGKGDIKYFRRTLQDFYILWHIMNDINIGMVRYFRLDMKKELKEIFSYLKDIPKEHLNYDLGHSRFRDKVDDFKGRYQKDERRLRLSTNDKLVKIKDQQNRCSLSGAWIFLGDDIEADHIIPLAVGGKDSMDNIAMAHKEENRVKGARS